MDIIHDELRYRSLSFRKRVVLCCRAQCVPYTDEETALSRQVGKASSDQRSEQNHLLRFLADHRHYIESPLYASLIIDIARCAPFTEDQIKEISLDMWGKEISVLEGTALPSMVDFEPWFNPSAHSQVMVHGVDPNPAMARYVYELHREWRSRQCERLHFPRISKKQASWDTVREWERITGEVWGKDRGYEFSQATIEKFHHDTGHALGGRCEARQKWYRSGLAPRTYYAQGGTAYQLSKWFQGMASDLVDLCPTTNHRTRLNPTRINLDDGAYLRIWDLKTFTSRMHEQRHYINRLADFCTGYDVEVVDPVRGKIWMDLGLFLRNYNQMNTLPSYSLERFSKHFEELESYHNVAGFLGVFGNLMTCTFLHGGLLLQTCDHPDQANCAGDDGHKREVGGNEEPTTRVIGACGIMEPEKEFRSDERGSVCLKRGLEQEGPHLIQKPMVIWPSLGILLSMRDAYPPQFGRDDDTMTEKLDSSSKEIMRFLTHIYSLGNIDDTRPILEYLRHLYNLFKFPAEGSLPQYGNDYLVPILPMDEHDLFSKDPLQRLLETHYRGVVTLPKRTLDESEKEFEWSVGFQKQCRMSRGMSYMELLGYVKTECRFISVSDDEGLELLKAEFLGPPPAVYDLVVLAVPPNSLQDLI